MYKPLTPATESVKVSRKRPEAKNCEAIVCDDLTRAKPKEPRDPLVVIFHELARGDDASRRKYIHLHYTYGVSPNAKRDTFDPVSDVIEPDPLSSVRMSLSLTLCHQSTARKRPS